MVMISLKQADLSLLVWVLTHNDILPHISFRSPEVYEILRKLKKASKKPFAKKVIVHHIERFLDYYPELKPKTRVKKQ